MWVLYPAVRPIQLKSYTGDAVVQVLVCWVLLCSRVFAQAICAGIYFKIQGAVSLGGRNSGARKGHNNQSLASET